MRRRCFQQVIEAEYDRTEMGTAIVLRRPSPPPVGGAPLRTEDLG